MTDRIQPEALRRARHLARYLERDYGTHIPPSEAVSELRRLYAENAALQQGYDAARLEIDHLRGATKSKLLAQPVAWMVYLPSIDTQHLYYSQEDMGYVDDVTNHADAEVTPLYEMAAPKAEVAPAADYDHGPQSKTVQEAARHVGKWLNERPSRPLDLRDVAMLSAHAQAADSVLEDAARWQALPAFFEEYQIDALKLYRDIDAYLDAARKQGAPHE